MKVSSNEKREMRAAILFILPNFIGFLLFSAIPIIGGFILSFTNFTGFWANSHFVGVENYINLLHDSDFLLALKNTAIFTFVGVPITIIAALLLALALTKKVYASGIFKTLLFFPSITAMVSVAIVWNLLFNPIGGPINMFLTSIGIKSPPGWLISQTWAIYAVTIVSIWKAAGYYMIMLLAGLLGIPKDLYESASIDGATGWKRFWYITWPLLSPTTFMVTILAIISSFQVFELVSILTHGGPGGASNVLVLLIYQDGFNYTKFGYASAMSYVLFLIIFIFTLIQFRLQKKWVTTLQ